jgi:hypothetical protein
MPSLSGRALSGMLAGQGLGLAVNLGTGRGDAARCGRGRLAGGDAGHAARRGGGSAAEIAAPGALPEALLTALDARLASAAGLARRAALVAVVYASGRRGHLLAFIDAVPGPSRRWRGWWARR